MNKNQATVKLLWMEYVKNVRQEKKVRHSLKDSLVIVLFAALANADDWVEVAGAVKP